MMTKTEYGYIIGLINLVNLILMIKVKSNRKYGSDK